MYQLNVGVSTHPACPHYNALMVLLTICSPVLRH